MTDTQAPERTAARDRGPAGASRRRLAAWVAVVVVGVGLLAAMALGADIPQAPLDPDGTGPVGARALVEVLGDHGVDVEVVRSVEDLVAAGPGAAGTSVVLGNPAYLGPSAAARLAESARGADRLVLLGPDQDQLDAMRLPVRGQLTGIADPVSADCTSEVARAEDTVTTMSTRYTPSEPASGGAVEPCFPLPEPGEDTQPGTGIPHGAGMLRLAPSTGHGEVLVVGFPRALTNQAVDEASHAGLAVRALGLSPRLVWYQPGATDLADDGTGPEATGVWPRWTGPLLGVLFVATVLLALARGRRLGRLVPEPLPVVVRAVETTESRGRLYHRAADRARTAAILRDATGTRLRRLLALDPRASLPVLLERAADASRLPADEVATILAGAAPTDDAALVRLARQLTDLEERVRPHD